MAKEIEKGLFITFEGPEGSGKSTHSRMIVEALEKDGFSVVHTFEPGDTSLGKKVRDILLEKDADTPCKRVYFVVQTLYFSPPDESSVIQLLSKLSIDIVKAAPSTAVHFDRIFNWVGKGKFYNALKEVKELIKYEETLLNYAKSAE